MIIKIKSMTTLNCFIQIDVISWQSMTTKFKMRICHKTELSSKLITKYWNAYYKRESAINGSSRKMETTQRTSENTQILLTGVDSGNKKKSDFLNTIKQNFPMQE